MNRATLYANADKILKYAKDIRDPGRSGDMFNSREHQLELEMTPMREWPIATRLWMERKSLGTWLSGHPMELVRGKYEHKVKQRIKDISSLLEIGGGPINFAFIITSFRLLGRILLMNVEDETGRGEMIAFNDEFAAFFHILQPDNICVAQCMCHYRNADASMRIMRMVKIGQLQKPLDVSIPE